MSTLISNATIQNRRDTAGNWTSNNPVLKSGEWGYEKDTGKVKIGDGTTAWTSLLYTGEPTYQVYNITTASDETYNLPDALSVSTEITVKRRGAGTGVVLFTTQSSQTIDGLAPTEFELRGEVEITLFTSGGNWEQKTVVKDWVICFDENAGDTPVTTLSNTFNDGKFRVGVKGVAGSIFFGSVILDTDTSVDTRVTLFVASSAVGNQLRVGYDTGASSFLAFTVGATESKIAKVEKWQDRARVVGA